MLWAAAVLFALLGCGDTSGNTGASDDASFPLFISGRDLPRREASLEEVHSLLPFRLVLPSSPLPGGTIRSELPANPGGEWLTHATNPSPA